MNNLSQKQMNQFIRYIPLLEPQEFIGLAKLLGVEIVEQSAPKFNENNKVNVIKTNIDSFHTSKLICLSNKIGTLLVEDTSKIFRENDYYSDFIEASKKLKHNNYPILDSNNKYV